MATASLITPVEQAFLKYGAALLAQDKSKLIAFIEPMVDADATTLIDALAAHVNLNGLASIAQNPIRNALTGSVSAVVDVINSNIEGGIETVDNWLTTAANNAVKVTP